MRIISNSITIDTSKIHSNNVVDLTNKPTFNTKQKRITDDNIRFMLFDWYFNKENTEYIHEHISKWDVSHVTSFKRLFYMMPEFNDDISNWDTSNVTDMSYMFYNCSKFDNDVRNWNIEKAPPFPLKITSRESDATHSDLKVLVVVALLLLLPTSPETSPG